jgi:hypothetical protein
MTQRLLEMQDYADRDEAEAARLLSAMAPVSPNEAAERRVYAKVCVRRSSAPRLVRAVVLVSVLLISTTIFSATLARRWLVGMFGRSSTSALVTPPAAKQQRLAASLSPQVEPAPSSPIAIAEEGAASSAVAPVDVRRDRVSKPSVARRRPAAVVSPRTLAEESPPVEEVVVAPPPPEEAALVLAAVRALRREHNPARAGDLLDEYLRRFPQGVLAEEALAVGIEAAVARLDARAARLLAEQYLGRYPAGRFVGLARKASGRL